MSEVQGVDEIGLNALKNDERFKAYPYQDGGGQWTQGWGHTKGVTINSKPIDRITGERWLREDLKPVESFINEHIPGLSQQRYNALARLLFNVGTNITDTRLYHWLTKDPDSKHVGYEWIEFCNDNGRFVPGLIKRRCREIDMYY